jgi:S-adenosylmethionine hydrolase
VPTVTLMTDFGWADGYAGVMKGVVLGICPEASIVDLSHDIPRHDAAAASVCLAAVWRYFPDGTVHVVVVDPGVGSDRRALAVRADRQYLVGPDNGVFTHVLDAAEQWAAVELKQKQYLLPNPSQTFHGRDVFAPVGAHIARGVPLDDFGPAVTDPVLLPVLRPEREGNVLRGHIAYVDSFGNLVTNIPADAITAAEGKVTFEIGWHIVEGVSRSYGDAPEGELLAVVGSWGTIEIAANRASATERTGARRGDGIVVYLEQEPPAPSIPAQPPREPRSV